MWECIKKFSFDFEDNYSYINLFKELIRIEKVSRQLSLEKGKDIQFLELAKTCQCVKKYLSSYETLEKFVENRGMHDLIQDIKIPTETVTEVKGENVKEYERKIFPGYVLIKMIVTNDSWYVVRNIHGCTGFVGPESKPVPLTDEEVIALGVEKHSVEVGYKVGDNIMIIDGPLKDFPGVVKEINVAENSVSVGINAFGRETIAELELDQVALAD